MSIHCFCPWGSGSQCASGWTLGHPSPKESESHLECAKGHFPGKRGKAETHHVKGLIGPSASQLGGPTVTPEDTPAAPGMQAGAQ